MTINELMHNNEDGEPFSRQAWITGGKLRLTLIGYPVMSRDTMTVFALSRDDLMADDWFLL